MRKKLGELQIESYWLVDAKAVTSSSARTQGRVVDRRSVAIYAAVWGLEEWRKFQA